MCSLELNKLQSQTRAGFGVKPNNPTFNRKSSSVSLNNNNDRGVFATSTSSLKSTASQNVTTTRLNNAFSSGLASNSSIYSQRGANYVSGYRFNNSANYVHDRNGIATGINTTSIGYANGGFRSGKNDLTLMTGLTQPMERRLKQRAGMVDLTTLQYQNDGSIGKKSSFWNKLAAGFGIGVGVVGIGTGVAAIIKNSKSSKSDTSSDIAKLNAQQQAKSAKPSEKGGKTTSIQSEAPSFTVGSASQQKVQSAKTSAECKEISADLDNKQQTINDSIATNTELLATAQQGKETATASINTANQNIQKQEGTITKLRSQLAAAKSAKEPDAKQIADLENQIKEAEQSKANSQATLKSAKADLAKCEQEISDINSDLKSLNAEKADVASGKTAADKKAAELEKKETAKA